MRMMAQAMTIRANGYVSSQTIQMDHDHGTLVIGRHATGDSRALFQKLKYIFHGFSEQHH